MAAAKLKRHQAIVWLPPRSVGERAFGVEASLVVQTGDSPTPVARRASLDSLQGIRQVWLIADARDVNLIEARLPPLAGARLRQALPNVVEEYLLQDVSRCLLAAGPVIDSDRRLVGVIDREWVEFVLGAFDRRRIKVEALWPAQLALPLADDGWSLAAVQGGYALRTSPTAGLGWTAGDDPAQQGAAAAAVLAAGRNGDVAPTRLDAWLENPAREAPVRAGAAAAGLPVQFAALPLVRSAPVDLLDGRASGMKAALAQFDWRIWRIPVGLAAACLVAALVGLNLQWGQLAAEKSSLRRAMESTYRNAFPGGGVVLDPALQMRRQVTELRTRDGRQGPDDFVPLFAAFAQAIGDQGSGGLAAIEYRDNRLKVRFDPATVEGTARRDQLRQACARLGLKLQFDNERDATATVSLQGA